MIVEYKRALITGATSGIGEALAFLLADQGVALILTGRNHERLSALSNQLGSKVKVIVVAADLAITADRKRVIDYVNLYAPNLVINNAGFGLYGHAIDLPMHAQLDILEVSGSAAFEITVQASKRLQELHRTGTIINVASAAAFYPFPMLAIYAATKRFMIDFSKSLDYELAPKGIRILVGCPGMVATHFGERASAGEWKGASSFAMSAEQAAAHLWWQIKKGKRCYVFDWKYRWGTYLRRFIPECWLASLLKSAIVKRINFNQ